MSVSWVWWCRPAILAALEAEVEDCKPKGNGGDLAKAYLKTKREGG